MNRLSRTSQPLDCPAGRVRKVRFAQEDNAAFYAGAALAALDPCARSETSFSGLWRSRLALAAAAAQMRMMGRRETEAELRDAIALRTHGDEVDGPAGGVLNAWRQLAKGSAAGLVTLIGPTARRWDFISATS